MADLPDIPDEAALAHRDGYVGAIPKNVGPDHHDPGKMSIDAEACLRTALESAWPHLYAAALRHAADSEIDVPSELVSDETLVDWENWVTRRSCAEQLHRMADEATR